MNTILSVCYFIVISDHETNNLISEDDTRSRTCYILFQWPSVDSILASEEEIWHGSKQLYQTANQYTLSIFSMKTVDASIAT